MKAAGREPTLTFSWTDWSWAASATNVWYSFCMAKVRSGHSGKEGRRKEKKYHCENDSKVYFPIQKFHTSSVSFTLRCDVGAAALRHQVVLQLLDLLPVLLQLHLKLLNQAAEVTSHAHTHRNKTPE